MDVPIEFSSKRSTKSGSKYDYVKVRVWLSEQDARDGKKQNDDGGVGGHDNDSSDSSSQSPRRFRALGRSDSGSSSTSTGAKKHYYVLSRFLLARMLTAARVPKKKATQIMLELKKKLVDENRLDISQKQLENEVFALLETNGFSKKYVECFGMITSFYHLKIPLIVYICGTACVGKSMIATHLAERLNLPNVLQTDLFAQIIRMSEDSPMHPFPLWDRKDVAGLQGTAASQAAAGAVGERSPTDSGDSSPVASLLHEFKRECACVRKSVQGDLEKSLHDGKSIILEGTYLDPAMFTDLYAAARGRDPPGQERAPLGELEACDPYAESEESTPASLERRDKTYSPIIVPIVLAMDKETHLDALDQWMTSSRDDPAEAPLDSEKEHVYQTLSQIQNYYVRFAKSHADTVKLCYVDPMRIQDTVDDLHSHLLEEIMASFPRKAKAQPP